MHRPLIGLAVVALLVGCGGDQPAPPTTAATPPAPTAPSTPSATTSAPTTASTESAPPPTPKPSLAELEKKTGQAFLDAFNAHDAKKIAETYTTDGTLMMAGPGGWETLQGRDAIEKHNAADFAAFPDAKVGFERVLQKANVVVCQWVFTGTNTGEMMGQKATGKAVGVHGVSVLWFDDAGLVKKEQAYMDVPTMLGQLGVTKEKVRPVAALPTSAEWVAAKDDDAEKKNVGVFDAQADAFNKHDMKTFGEVLPDDTTQIDYSSTTDAKGKKAVLAFIGGYFKAFPDLKLSFDDGGVWGFGDYVVDVGIASGTNNGPLGPIKPTKKPVTVHACEINLVKDGKIAKTETYMNSAEMLDALGLLPKTKEAKEPKPPAKSK